MIQASRGMASIENRPMEAALKGKLRWESTSTFNDEWKLRTDTLISWIPDGASVLEFGSGTLVARESLLGRGCQYRNSDWVQRDEETLVLDLNVRPLPRPSEIGPVDYLMFAGTFEYISGLEELFEWLTQVSDRMVFSFMPMEGVSLDAIAYQECLQTRVNNGVVNHHTSHEFVTLVSKYFSIADTSIWRNQILFHGVSNRAVHAGRGQKPEDVQAVSTLD